MKKQLKWLTLLLCLMFLMTGCDVEENLGITSESSSDNCTKQSFKISALAQMKKYSIGFYNRYSVTLID